MNLINNILFTMQIFDASIIFKNINIINNSRYSTYQDQNFHDQILNIPQEVKIIWKIYAMWLFLRFR